MNTTLWVVRIIVALVIGVSFYHLFHSVSLGEFALYFFWLIGWGVGGVLWIRYLERIQEEDQSQDIFAP